MNPILVASTAALVGLLLYSIIGTWRLYAGRSTSRPVIEYVAMALLCGSMVWQSVTWLGANHPNVTEMRRVGVWLQLVAASGVTGLMLVSAAIARARTPHSR